MNVPNISHFLCCIVKLGFAGVYMYFLILLQSIDFGHYLYPQYMICAKTLTLLCVFFSHIFTVENVAVYRIDVS